MTKFGPQEIVETPNRTNSLHEHLSPVIAERQLWDNLIFVSNKPHLFLSELADHLITGTTHWPNHHATRLQRLRQKPASLFRDIEWTPHVENDPIAIGRADFDAVATN